MKILLITHLVPYPPRGGVMIRNFNLLKEMAKKHEIHLVTFNQTAHFANAEEYEQSKAALSRYCKDMRVFEIPTDRSRLAWYFLLFRNLFSLTPYSVWRFHSRAMVKAIRDKMRTHNFDLMEIGTIALAEYARLAPRMPKILVHHNIESQLLLRRSRVVSDWVSKIYLSYQAWKLKRYERSSSELFDYQTVCSAEDKDTLQQFCPEARVVVVPNGVDIETFKPSGERETPNSLIYVGGLSWFPNRDAIMFFYREIWPLLKNELPGVSFNHIGKGRDRELEEFSKRDNNFKLAGFVDDIRPLVGSASVYIVPLRVGGGTRLKILDAMAMGKAIVSTSVGAEGIRVEHEKEILIADDPEDFARKTIDLLKNAEYRTRLGENARKKAVGMYSWEGISPTLDDTYEEAIARRKTL